MPTLTPPTRLLVLMALTDSLEQVSGNADGYEYDLRPTTEVPKRVYRGRVLFGDDDPIPMVSILESPVPIEGQESDADKVVKKGDWELILQGWCEDDDKTVNPTDAAQYLLADVKRRLAIEKERDRDFNILGMGDVVTALDIGVGVVRPPDEVSAKAYFWLNIKLNIIENLLCPREA